MPARKSHSKERTVRTPAVIERVQALISDDLRQLLRVLMDVAKPWMETVVSERPCSSAVRCTSSCEFDLKLALRQCRYVLVKEFWSPNNPDLNPLDYYVWSVIERVTNKSRHSNVTSLRIAIEAAFVGMDSITTCV